MSKDYILTGLMAVAYAGSIAYVGGTTNFELVASSMLLLAGCTIWLCRAVSGHAFTWGPVHNVLVAYLGLLALLVYTSTLAENSLHFAWLFSTFVMMVLLAADLSRDKWMFLFGLFAITGVVSALWGIAELMVTRTQANGPVIDPNLWATISNLFFFGCLGIYLTGANKYRYLALAGLFVFAAAVFAAFSRAGLIVFFAAFVFSLVVCFRVKKVRVRLVNVVAVVAVAFTLTHSLVGWEEARQGRETGFSLGTGGWQSRMLQWEGALEIYQKYPLFGSGPGTFNIHYPTVRTIEDLGTAGSFAHNDYVQMLSEGGPMLVLFVGAFVALLIYGLVSHTYLLFQGQSKDVEPVLLIVAMGTALTHALINFPLYSVQVQMMLGLLFARYLNVSGMVRSQHVAINSPRLTGAGIVIGAVAAASMPVLDAISTDLVLNQNRIPIFRRVSSNVTTYRDTVFFLHTVRRNNWMNRFAMSGIYRQNFDEQSDPAAKRSLAVAAAFECQAAVELNPYQRGVRNYCAEFLQQNPWLQEVEGIKVAPEGLLREGVEIAPVYIESYMELAEFLVARGREDEAYRVLVDEALGYLNLKHGTYYEKRYELSLLVLRGANAREDKVVLEQLLALL